MQMTEGEIRASYRQAKDKKKQIGILADLNSCPKEEIKRILEGGTMENPKRGRKPKSLVETPGEEKKEAAVKSPKVRTVRIVRNTTPVKLAVMEVPRNVKGVMDEKLLDMRDSLTRLKADYDKLGRDIARREKDYEDYRDFVTTVVIKHEEVEDGEE